jgi:hypothetical protein
LYETIFIQPEAEKCVDSEIENVEEKDWERYT